MSSPPKPSAPSSVIPNRAEREARLERLLGEDVEHMLPTTRQLFSEILPAGLAQDAEPLTRGLRVDYAISPVSVAEFIDNHMYLGESLRGSIFPRYRG